MTPLPAPPPTPDLFVLVWREPPSSRIKTYVDPDTLNPYEYALEDLTPSPTPDEIISTLTELETWLDSDTPEPRAIHSDLAREHLGWIPVPAPVPFTGISTPLI